MKRHANVIGWGFATKGITLLLFYALQIFLVRKLPLAEYGLWSLFFSTFMVALFLSECGVNSSARKYIAEHQGTECAEPVLSAAMKLRLIASAVFALALTALAKPLSAMLEQPALAPMFMLAGPMLFLSGIVEYYKSIFMGLRRINFNFQINAVEHGFKLLFSCAAIYFAFRLPFGLLAAFTAALALAASGGFFMAGTVEHPESGQTPSMMRQLMGYALPLFISGAVLSAVTELDTMFVGALRGAEEAGIYNAAKQIVVKGPHVSIAIAMGVMPAFAKLSGRNKEEMRRLFKQLMLTNTALMGTVSLVIALFADKILLILYGAKCLPAAPAFRMLSVFLMAASYAVYLVNFLEYQGLAWKIAVNTTAAIALDIVLLVFLVPALGGLGAAVSLSAGFSAFAILCWLDVRKSLS